MPQDSWKHSINIMLTKIDIGMTNSRCYNSDKHLGITNIVIDFHIAINKLTAGTIDDKRFRSHGSLCLYTAGGSGFDRGYVYQGVEKSWISLISVFGDFFMMFCPSSAAGHKEQRVWWEWPTFGINFIRGRCTPHA